MFGLGLPELAVILVIILIIFGAGKLPQIGSGIGKGIHNFKKAIQEKPDELVAHGEKDGLLSEKEQRKA
ncbi:twin-arginine translocase TatA/TatE family subunit [Thermodesulfobacteriota bacterium]